MRDTTGLVAFFHPGDERWHSDWRDATSVRVQAATSCSQTLPSLVMPDFKVASEVPLARLCPICWG